MWFYWPLECKLVQTGTCVNQYEPKLKWKHYEYLNTIAIFFCNTLGGGLFGFSTNMTQKKCKESSCVIYFCSYICLLAGVVLV